MGTCAWQQKAILSVHSQGQRFSALPPGEEARDQWHLGFENLAGRTGEDIGVLVGVSNLQIRAMTDRHAVHAIQTCIDRKE